MTIASPTRQTLARAVRTYVALGSGLPLTNSIPQNDNAPSPKGVYATTLLVNRAAQGPSWVRESETIQAIEGMFSIQWYRRGAYDAADRFRIWAKSQNGLIEAHAHGLTFLRMSPMRDLAEVVSAQYEERAGLDLYMGFTATLEGDFGSVENVDIELLTDSDYIGNDDPTPRTIEVRT